MADIWTQAKRSEVMARIRGRGNRSTEGRMAKLFRVHGFTGWRRQRPLPGRPDFVCPARRLAVFVDGCFWHGCPRHGTMPKGNRSFWRAKITRNRERDREVGAELRRLGWKVLRVWEH
ncbi:MAG: very short patch repair endonuclease, partial [Opitutaceae bacterium]